MSEEPVRIARHPDGRIVVPITWGDEDVLLDMESGDATEAARAFLFIKDGSAPEITTWVVRRWERVAHQRIVSLDAVVRPNVDFILWFRARGATA